MEILTGFLLGFLGSFHCAVMCGPIALSLPFQKKSKLSFLIERLVYNSGRIITYTLLGFIFGFLGERIFLAGLQQVLSVAAGVIIIFYIAKTFLGRKQKFFRIEKRNSRFSFLKNSFAKLYSKNSKVSFLGIGILNGFLPCGFVYIAVTGAAVQTSPMGGALFMALFGIGTLPLMLGISMSKNFISINLRRRINKLSPALAVILAIIFIARGLNLGIPYLSPKLQSSAKQTEEVICH